MAKLLRIDEMQHIPFVGGFKCLQTRGLSGGINRMIVYPGHRPATSREELLARIETGRGGIGYP
jgi:hypothetical protein